MTTTKKLTIAVIALSLILVGVVGGTLAWLSATSETVTNTFTYGNITIKLTETGGEDKGTSREFARIVPGAAVDKKPTVTVNEGSEKCYVYVLIDNQFGTDATYDIDASKWEKISTDGTKVLYRYTIGSDNIVDAFSADQVLPVFTKLTFSSDLTKAHLDAFATPPAKVVTIQAYAHQADNTTQDVADDAAKAWATTP